MCMHSIPLCTSNMNAHLNYNHLCNISIYIYRGVSLYMYMPFLRAYINAPTREYANTPIAQVCKYTRTYTYVDIGFNTGVGQHMCIHVCGYMYVYIHTYRVVIFGMSPTYHSKFKHKRRPGTYSMVVAIPVYI